VETPLETLACGKRFPRSYGSQGTPAAPSAGASTSSASEQQPGGRPECGSPRHRWWREDAIGLVDVDGEGSDARTDRSEREGPCGPLRARLDPRPWAAAARRLPPSSVTPTSGRQQPADRTPREGRQNLAPRLCPRKTATCYAATYRAAVFATSAALAS
jgi:hypothetical protein